MAEYRLCYKKGKKGYAQNHAEYIMRENGYKGKEDLVYKESGNMPSFTEGSSAIDFWAAADSYERENSNTYREFELNIPNELSHEQALELIQNFVKKELGNQPYSFAIHDEKKDGVKNLHCHLMFSERSLDGIERDKEKYFKRANSKNISKGGAKKNEYFKQKEALINFRKSWEGEQNKLLEKLGIEARVDCRSLTDRKLEAIENNNMELAEALDRNPVNISKSIANTVKYKGEEKLSPTDKEKYNNFKVNRVKKYSNERLLEIKKGNILPTEKECKERLEFLEKKDINLVAINIISKGEYKRLEARINGIKIDFDDIDIFKRIRLDLETRKKEIEHEVIDTKKYKSLMYFLKQDLKQEKHLYSDILEKQYRNKTANVESIADKKESLEISEIEYEKLYQKYSHYSLDKLEFRLKEIEHEKAQDRATAIITNYRKESLISNYILFKDELKNSEQRKLAQEAINSDSSTVKKQIDLIKSKLEFIDLEYQNLGKKIVENQSKIDNLANNLVEQNKKERIIINELINQKSKDRIFDIGEEIRRSIKIESEYIKSQKTFEYFSQNNKNEKYNRALYNINKKLEILGNEKEIYHKKISKLNRKEINNILDGIKKENKKILDMSKPKLERLKKAQEHLKQISDDKVIKKLTLNKMTKGTFMKELKEKIKLSNEIKNLNTELEKLGKFDFMKKGKISSEIAKKTELYNTYLENEKNMTVIVEKNPDYNKNFNEIKNNIEVAQNNINNQIIKESKTINEKITELKATNNITKKINKNTKSQKLQQAKGAGVDKNNTSLGKIISQIEQENNYVGGNNLDLDLKEEEVCTL